MGTTYVVKAALAEEIPAGGAELGVRIGESLAQVNRHMSTYLPTSEVSRFNNSRQRTPFKMTPPTLDVTRRAVEIGRMTHGAFDITLGPLIRLWGFDNAERRPTLPTKTAIAMAQGKMGIEKLVIGVESITKKNEELEINLSGLAKGYAVDRLVDLLMNAGARSGLVEIGGEVRGFGKNPKGIDWRIGINMPTSSSDATEIAGVVVLGERALATSGSYRNFFLNKGQRFSHIIDPRTAAPVTHRLVSVSIIAKDCMTADALATAAMVLGEDKMRQIIDNQPDIDALFIHALEATDAEGENQQPHGLPVLKMSQTAGFPLQKGEPVLDSPYE